MHSSLGALGSCQLDRRTFWLSRQDKPMRVQGNRHRQMLSRFTLLLSSSWCPLPLYIIKRFFQLYTNAGWTTNRIKSLDLFMLLVAEQKQTYCRMGEKANIVIFKVSQTVDQIKPEMFWKISLASLIWNCRGGMSNSTPGFNLVSLKARLIGYFYISHKSNCYFYK